MSEMPHLPLLLYSAAGSVNSCLGPASLLQPEAARQFLFPVDRSGHAEQHATAKGSGSEQLLTQQKASSLMPYCLLSLQAIAVTSRLWVWAVTYYSRNFISPVARGRAESAYGSSVWLACRAAGCADSAMLTPQTAVAEEGMLQHPRPPFTASPEQSQQCRDSEP